MGIIQLQQLAPRVETLKKSLALLTALLSCCTHAPPQALGQSDHVTPRCIGPASSRVTSVTSVHVAVWGTHPAPCPADPAPVSPWVTLGHGKRLGQQLGSAGVAVPLAPLPSIPEPSLVFLSLVFLFVGGQSCLCRQEMRPGRGHPSVLPGLRVPAVTPSLCEVSCDALREGWDLKMKFYFFIKVPG